jgi:hypothetical protein
MKNLLAGMLIATAVAMASANAQPVIDPPNPRIIADYMTTHGLEDASGNFTFESGTTRVDTKNQITYVGFDFTTADKASGQITLMLRRDAVRAAELLNGGNQSDFYRLAAEVMHQHATTGRKEDADDEAPYFWAWRAPSGQQWELIWVATNWQNVDIIVTLRNARADLLVTSGEQSILDQTFNDALAVARLASTAAVVAYVVAPVEDLTRNWRNTFGKK